MKRRNHTKNYLRYFGYSRQDTIPCEVCEKTSRGKHHIIFRSKGGSNRTKNIIALCGECDDRAHNRRNIKKPHLSAEKLNEIHAKKIGENNK